MNDDSLLNDVVVVLGVLFLIVIKAIILTAILYFILVIVPSKIIEFFCQDSTTQLTCKADNVDNCISTFKANSHNYVIDHMIEMTDDSVVFSIKKVK